MLFFETMSMFHEIEINPSSPTSFQHPAECLMAKIAAVFYDKDQQLSNKLDQNFLSLLYYIILL